jgi:hypothetical protein
LNFTHLNMRANLLLYLKLFWQNKIITLRETSPNFRLKKEIDFFKSASHVDFLKARIKLVSNLANFQNFWTNPLRYPEVRRE